MAKGKGKKGKKSKKEGKSKAPPLPHEYYVDQINRQDENFGELLNIADTEVFNLAEVSQLNEQINQDKGDIASYLQRIIREKEVAIEELNDLAETIIDKEKLEEYENELKFIAEEHKNYLKNAEIEKLRLIGNLKQMSETSHEKKKIEKQIEERIQMIEKQEITFAENIYQAEKDSLKRRDGIKESMVKNVKQLTKDFLKLHKAQVSKVSEEAIMKNSNLRKTLQIHDSIVGDALDNNTKYKQELERITLYSKSYETTNANPKIPTGTIAAFRRENAVRAKRLQDLVVEYREIEARLRLYEDRQLDLGLIKTEISEITRKNVGQLEKLHFDATELNSRHENLTDKIEKVDSEFVKVEDIAVRIFNDLKKGGLSKETAKMVLQNNFGGGEEISREIHSHYTPGAINIIPG